MPLGGEEPEPGPLAFQERVGRDRGAVDDAVGRREEGGALEPEAPGQLGEAVALLTDSITLNLEKGSPIGLTFNRQTCEALATAAAQSHGPGTERLQGALADLEGRLAQAEAVLGRVGLPGAAGEETVAPSHKV